MGHNLIFSFTESPTHIAKMMKLVFLCVVGVVAASPDRRFFGGGVGHHGTGGFGGIGGIGGIGGGIGGIGGAIGGSSSTCRYWCKNPQGQAYCCENNAQAPSPVVGTKQGYCPPVRPSCPPTRFFGGPPQTCSNDGSCPGVDKCCYDTCLSEHVCKPPRGSGGFLG